MDSRAFVLEGVWVFYIFLFFKKIFRGCDAPSMRTFQTSLMIVNCWAPTRMTM